MRSINKQPKKPFFIVSAYIGSEDDVDRSIKLEQELKAMKLPFKTLIGSWKGQTELSYLVITDTVKEAHSYGRAFADAYDQEAFVVVDANRNGKCVRTNYFIPSDKKGYVYGSYEGTNLGKLVLTDKRLIGDNWSRCPMTDKYYTFNGGE